MAQPVAAGGGTMAQPVTAAGGTMAQPVTAAAGRIVGITPQSISLPMMLPTGTDISEVFMKVY